MIAYIVRRLIIALFILILVTVITFLALRLLPGDPIYMFISSDQYNQFTDEQIQQMRKEYGLDKSIPLQYVDWVSGILRGDYGTSITQHKTVTDLLIERVPVTMHLGILTFIIYNLIGIPAGIICATRRGSWIDTVVTVLANIGITAPVFWLGILMIYTFGLYLKWLPIYGYTSPFTDFVLSTKQVIMPIFCLAIFPIASTTRLARSSMLEVMRQDYIRTAWSKGLRERSVVLKHALKNSLITVVTMEGMGIAMIFGGSVLIETVFNIPGMGRLMVTGVLSHDYPVVQGILLIIATIIILSNLFIDLSYGWLDPRVRYG